MKIASYNGVSRQEDIQIQASLQKLGFDLFTNDDQFPANETDYSKAIFLRLRLVSHTLGTVQVIDRMPLVTLLEMEGLERGYFVLEEYSDGAAATVGWRYHYRGLITVGIEGALELNDGEYLSLDLEGASNFKVDIETIDSPDLVKQYQRVNPQSIQGVTREISLQDARGIVVAPARVRDMHIQFEKRGVPVTQHEMITLAQYNNEVICMDYAAKRATCGYKKHVIYGVGSASNPAKTVTITPQDDNQFYVYTISVKSL